MTNLSPIQLKKAQALAALLNSWRTNGYGLGSYHQARSSGRAIDVAALLRNDSSFTQMELCDLLGRPEVQLIDTALSMLLPPVYAAEAELLKEALLVLCREQGGPRQAKLTAAGLGLGVVLILLWLFGE
jgi:hypothetical protein